MKRYSKSKYAGVKMANGGSVYDYMEQHGQDGSYENRKKMFNNLFNGQYVGNADQNNRLLQMLQNHQASIPAPVQPAQAPQQSRPTPRQTPPNAPSVQDVAYSQTPVLQQQSPYQSPALFHSGNNPNSWTQQSAQPPVHQMTPFAQQRQSVESTAQVKPARNTTTTKTAPIFDVPAALELVANGIKRTSIYNNLFGNEDQQVSKLPSAPPPKSANAAPQVPPIVTGDTLWDSKRVYHIPEVADLNRLKFGARNRGDDTPVNSDAMMFTNFDNAKVVSSKNTKMDPNQTYVGIDKGGNMKIGNGNMFGDQEYQLSPFSSQLIKGFAKDDKGNYVTQNADQFEHGHSVPMMTTPDGKQYPTNFLVKRGDQKAFDTYGNITGGRVIITSPDYKKSILLSGSVNNINDQLEKFKKDNNLDQVRYVRVDNGSFSRGYRTKDGKINQDDWKSFDLRNTGGGNGFYLQGKGYKYGGNFVSKTSAY